MALAGRYLRVMLLWNPLLAVGICVVLGPSLRRFVHGVVFSDVVATVVFAVVAAGRRAGVTRPAVRLGLVALGLPVGIFAAFRATPILTGGRSGGPPTSLELRIALFLGALVAALFILSRSRREAVLASALRLREAEKRRLEAQLAALTAQMNPHLMFNALNTIASLIESDPAGAEEMVVRLSELYRAVLTSTQRSLHPLADELRLCRAYLDVERARFGPRLAAAVEVEPGLDAERVQVPVLLLQPLVENAVRHGLGDRTEGGTVTIGAARRDGHLELRVDDDGVGLGGSPRAGSGLGVANCRERMTLSYGEVAHFELGPRPGGGTRALLRLPL